MIKTVLHVGCGGAQRQDTHALFHGEDWEHVRVDIDKEVNPDVIDDIRILANFSDCSVSGIYSSHNLEHLHYNDSIDALVAFLRVLKPGGLAILTMPDLESVAELILKNGLTSVAYVSPAGPITPLDMIYGYRPYTKDNVYQRHLTGYTKDLLRGVLINVGFSDIQIIRENFALWAFARKPVEV